MAKFIARAVALDKKTEARMQARADTRVSAVLAREARDRAAFEQGRDRIINAQKRR